MVVAVQRGLGHIKDKLREMGYEIVTLGDYNYPIDAIVYTGSSVNTSFVTNSNMPAFTSHTMPMDGSSRSYGVLMVNAEGKTIAQIDQILKKRVYSPLF